MFGSGCYLQMYVKTFGGPPNKKLVASTPAAIRLGFVKHSSFSLYLLSERTLHHRTFCPDVANFLLCTRDKNY